MAHTYSLIDLRGEPNQSLSNELSNERDRDFSTEKILRACKHFSDRVKKYKKDWKVRVMDFWLNYACASRIPSAYS